MRRVEAYHILQDMYDEATDEQRAAISIAMDDIEFVDLMPDDMVAVRRCKDCVRCDEERTMLGTVLFCNHWVRNTVSDGYCHEGFAKGR